MLHQYYSRFHITLPDRVPNYVRKFRRLAPTSELQTGVRYELLNFSLKLGTSFPPKFGTWQVKMADAELVQWMSGTLKNKLDKDSFDVILNTLKANQFTSRLQLKLLKNEQVDMMFKQDLSLGAKTLLLYQLDLLRDESPLPSRQRCPKQVENSDDKSSESSQAKKSVLPAFEKQKKDLQDQLQRLKQEWNELQTNVDSMNIDIPQRPAIGNARLVCSHCHHRGHRNQASKPCSLRKCDDYTYCGLKDKHPEYFSKLSSLKSQVRVKNTAIQDLENQIKAMDDFSSNSEFHFIKALAPRLYAVDPSYKTNKAKLMRDVRLLRQQLDGKIPPVTTNDVEQLKILLSKCKKSVQQHLGDVPDLTYQEESIITPLKETQQGTHTDSLHKTLSSDGSSTSKESDDMQQFQKKRKHKHKKASKKAKWITKRKHKKLNHRFSSSDEEEYNNIPSHRPLLYPNHFGYQYLVHNPTSYFPSPMQITPSPYTTQYMPYNTVPVVRNVNSNIPRPQYSIVPPLKPSFTTTSLTASSPVVANVHSNTTQDKNVEPNADVCELSEEVEYTDYSNSSQNMSQSENQFEENMWSAFETLINIASSTEPNVSSKE